MDAEIQFGELSEEKPRVMLRPDENRHYAVAPCGQPRQGELPVFVDLDAMLDMEFHAQSNTNVELGGVMLGGQYVDKDDQPFVVISDCLRADHFEATKGSFKFTHDTWSDIQRRLEEFPEEIRMVGWYHTHPDWGVFLSGMDLFICENFFNKPLDLALVIDPCRDDRGWFQWAAGNRRKPLRMGGFHLISSRFREEELQSIARALEGSETMPVATRSGSQMSGGYGAPVVNVVQDRGNQWMQIAAIGSLVLQTAMIALIAMAMLRPATKDADEAAAKLAQEKIALEARREALGDIAARLTDADSDIVEEYEKLKRQKNFLDTSLEIATSQHTELADKVEKLEKDLKKLNDLNEKLAKEKSALIDKGEKLQATINELTKSDSKGGLANLFRSIPWSSPWLWAGIVTCVVIVGFGIVMLRGPRERDHDRYNDYIDEEDGPANRSKDLPDETNT